MRRRDYLRAVGGTSLATIVAGCGSSGSSGDSSPDSDTDTTPNSDGNDNTPIETAESTDTPTPEPASFNVVDVSAPSSVDIGELFRVEITVENTGEQLGQWQGEFEFQTTAGPEPDDWELLLPELSIAGGETATWESGRINYDRPVVFYYRLEAQPTQSVEIPASKAPIITDTNLVSDWSSFGDAKENAISEAEAGSFITIATRYWEWIENGSHDTRIQISVFNDADERVELIDDTSNQITDTDGWISWETGEFIDTQYWDPGTYTAEVLIRDNQSEDVSGPDEVTFDLVQSGE